ncbi:uncharacterized protein LOC123559547 isoform X2 [Mercenaria mercenaria]|uniref:uncharacterized protein LOC123559547 isoform X2 n=1 Tax=Mercenaria mercenaria TaxID=6596 RepID=UPI00234E4266|nr:uncharacterized protein LOC123559547 isoform X2 [Mercenaria mercenaria]
MHLTSFTFLMVHVVNSIRFVDGQTDCGRISLTYVQAGSTVEAKLRFSPSTELSRYKWVHFFSRTKPNFDFFKNVEEDRSKYDLKDFELIIKDLQASDDGIYNTECYLENGYQTFSKNKVEIRKPYSVHPFRNSTADINTKGKTMETTKFESKSTVKNTSKTKAYVIGVTSQTLRRQNKEPPRKIPATPKHDTYKTYEVLYSRSDKVTPVSKLTEITTDDICQKTAATHKYDMSKTNEVPYSRFDKVTPASKITEITTDDIYKKTVEAHKHDTSKTNEVSYSEVTPESKVSEVTTDDISKETTARHKHDMSKTNEVPYSISDKVTPASKITEDKYIHDLTAITNKKETQAWLGDSAVTTVLVTGGSVLVIIVFIAIATIAFRKKTCPPYETKEDNAHYCEINQLEDGRIALGIQLQTFSCCSSKKHSLSRKHVSEYQGIGRRIRE